MEVFLAILLLFGAYSLGAAGHDAENDHPQTAALHADTRSDQAVHDAARQAKRIEPIDLLECAADRHYVIYKDLTHSEARKDAKNTTPSNECEGTCRDE